MPTVLSLYAMAVWFCVGLATGAGWTLGSWVVGRIVARVVR